MHLKNLCFLCLSETSLALSVMNPASLCLDEDPQSNDEMNLRQPPPYPGHVKAWQQPGTAAAGAQSLECVGIPCA